MNTAEKIKYVYFLMNIGKLGNTRIRNILYKHSDPYDFFNCSQSELRKIDGIDYSISMEILGMRNKRKIIEEEAGDLINESERKNINIVTILDDNYPDNLKKVFDAPVMLFYKGKLNNKDKYSLSIVGTRNPTEYGKYTCEKFTEKLCELGIPLISGFARGIDSIVHKVCLKKRNLTYAVFGCGVDVVYPSENRKLYSELIERGAVVSEFPVGSKPEKVNFPKRNRIISGISLGSLIIESGIKGGSLLTAEFAIDQGKEVFAVPGYINSKQSEGTNEIIKRGEAKLVTDIEDIISELEIKLRPVLKTDKSSKEEKLAGDLNESEKKIFISLDYEPVNIDTINENTGLSISECLVSLLSLEFKGLVRQIPGKNFMKA